MIAPTIEKVFNVSAHEVPRTSYAWLIKFLHRVGFLIGWTTLTALFVTRYGITGLPMLFLFQSFLTIFGMVVFSFFHDRVPIKMLMASAAFFTGLLLFLATLVTSHELLFFALLLVALGFFMPQLTILLSNFFEDFFSPLEAERIFPIVESAETIGGIFAGLLMISFSFLIAPYKFLYVWIFFLFLMASVLFFLQPSAFSYVHLTPHKERRPFAMKDHWKNFSHRLKEIHSIPFLQGLFLIFLLQWMIGYLFEFQYTKVLDASIAQEGGGEAHAGGLAHGLGSFHILFHSCALFVQLLLASRIVRALGTVGSFLLHALVTCLSAISLFISFGFFTAILAKNNFEISGVIHKNAYENSYYALKHGTQRSVREFFEAFLYPLGTIVGTALLVGIQLFFLPEHVTAAIQIVLLFFAFFMLILALHLQGRYTELARDNLLKTTEKLPKFNAIEILSQKGHRRNIDILLKALGAPVEHIDVKAKILDTLGQLGQPRTLPDIVRFLHHREQKLVLAAVLALEHFPHLGDHLLSQVFSRYRIVSELKNLFLQTADEHIQVAIIRTLARLQYDEIVPFLLNVLQHSSPVIQGAAICVCSSFNDPHTLYYLEPFLKHRNPFVRAQTVLALWPYKKYRKRLQSTLTAMLSSALREDLLAGVSILGDIGNQKHKDFLIPSLTVLDPELRLLSSHALLKLGYKEAGPYLVQLLLNRNPHILQKAYHLLKDLRPDMQRYISHLLQKEVARKMHHLFTSQESVHFDYERMDTESLERFQNAYLCIESYGEADYIDSILKKRREQQNEGMPVSSLAPAITTVSS